MRLSIQNNELIEELADKIIDVFGLSTSQSEQKTKVINLINDELYQDFKNVTLKTIIENYLKTPTKTENETNDSNKLKENSQPVETPASKQTTAVKSPFVNPAKPVIAPQSEESTVKASKKPLNASQQKTPEVNLSMNYPTEEPVTESENKDEPKLTLQSMINLNKPQGSSNPQTSVKKEEQNNNQPINTSSNLSLASLSKLNQPTISQPNVQTTETPARQVLTDKSPVEFLQENPNITAIPLPYNHHEYELSHTVIKKGVDRGHKLYVIQYHLTPQINELVKQNLPAITETVDQLNPYPNGQYLMKYNENHALCFVISDYEHLNERINALDSLIESIEQNLNRTI